MSTTPVYRKKLIEVALPLEAINRESAREKSIRHGHPSTLHLWWARRPLAAARAILFAQLVDDPSAWPERFPTEADQDRERKRLFGLIEELVTWEASIDDRILRRARLEIAQSWARNAPSPRRNLLALSPDDLERSDVQALVAEYLATEVPRVHDPFAGGGTIPLEAQRLGLRAVASDLNPVAVLINKALIEIPARFVNRAPVGTNLGASQSIGMPKKSKKRAQDKLGIAESWRGVQGIAEDVRHYAAWMRDEAERRIGALYADVELDSERLQDRGDLAPFAGQRLPVIAWVWARTVASPDPAFSTIHIPLVSTFWLSMKPGKETWIEPVIHGKGYSFSVRRGQPSDPDAVAAGTKEVRGGFRCLFSGAAIPFDYVRAEAAAGRMRERLMAVVLEGRGTRVYLSPTEADERLACSATPAWLPEGALPDEGLGFRVQNYGLRRWDQLYSPRQLVALTTFSELVLEARAKAVEDARTAGFPDDARPLANGGAGAVAYGDAIAVYLACAVDKTAEALSTLCTWSAAPKNELVVSTFRRQAVSMTWDYAEANPLGNSSGSLLGVSGFVAKVLDSLRPTVGGIALQQDATQPSPETRVVSTDPPYYDNIGYADLSDFFYVWLRRTLRDVLPLETSTLLVPKRDELVADPSRHGGRDAAERFFVDGMTKALQSLHASTSPVAPTTVYYAFKQAETGNKGTSSTGWETFLEAVVRAGFEIRGTWPVRTERAGRSRDIGSNALATSVVLAIRHRAAEASVSTSSDFRRALRQELPAALRALQHSRIAPVDVAQAAIGPGMAVYSRYAKVLEPDGSAMTVRSALRLVNEMLDEHLTAQECEFDADTRFAVTWYEVHAFEAGPYGEAETLAKARAVAVSGIAEAGILRSGGGKVRLLKRQELPADWDPANDTRLTVWEATQHLIKRLEEKGEDAAADLLERLGGAGDAARDLAYRLYTACERKGWAEEARAYNGLVAAWADLERLATARAAIPVQENLI